MILFFDTETTGFFSDRLPLDHDDQPHLCQIAAILTSDNGKEMSQFSLIVNPGIPIPDRASEVHGITDDIARSFGVQESSALGLFNFMAARADLVVAHNAKFDMGVMSCLCARQHVEEVAHQTLCTMDAASPIMDLPPTERMVRAGFNKPKPPKLEECVSFFFNETLEGAHDALVDVRACARVFFHLLNSKHINLPEVQA